MSTTVEVNVKVTGAKKAAGEVGDVANEAQKTNEAVGGMSGALDKMTGGMITTFKNIGKGLKTGVKGLKTFRLALISTGIGALVVLVGSLVAYFTQTAEGSKTLQRVMGGLGAVIQVITDLASTFGEKVWEAINNPRQAFDDLALAAEGVWDWFVQLGDFIKQTFTIQLKALEKGFLTLRIGWNKLTGDAEEADKLTAALEEVNAEIGEIARSMLEDLDELAEPFIEAGKAAGEFFDTLVDTYNAADALVVRTIDLAKAQADLKITMANGNAQLKAYNRTANDTTLGFDKRLNAAKKANALEAQLMAERVQLITEERNILKAQNALSKEASEEDKNALIDLEVALINIQSESTEMQINHGKRLKDMSKEYVDNMLAEGDAALEAAAEKKAALKEVSDEEKRLAAEKAARKEELESELRTDEENELEALRLYYERLQELAVEFGHSKKDLEDRQKAAEDKVTEKWRKKRAKDEDTDLKATIDKKKEAAEAGLQVAEGALNFLTAMNDASDKKTLAQQKKAFENDKKIQIAQALISASRGIINILSNSSTIPDPYGTIYKGVQIAFLAGTAAAQIAKIKKAQFSAPGSVEEGGSAPGGSSSAPMTQALVPTSFGDSVTAPTPGDTTEMAPVQAFVVSTEVTSQQQLDSQISHQSSL